MSSRLKTSTTKLKPATNADVIQALRDAVEEHQLKGDAPAIIPEIVIPQYVKDKFKEIYGEDFDEVERRMRG